MGLIVVHRSCLSVLRTAVLLLLVSCSVLFAENIPFTHPGMYVDAGDLGYIRGRIAARAEPWSGACRDLLARADRGYTPHIFRVVYEGNGTDPHPTLGAEEFCKDAEIAYDFALAWALTGKAQYAATSIRILNTWSSNLQDVMGRNAELRIGLATPYFCNAAELLRHYVPPGGTASGWTAADITRFKGMLSHLFYAKIKGRTDEIHGNNWITVIFDSITCIAVFCDDHAMFATMLINYPKLVPNYVYSTGQCQESGRDQGHTQMGLAGMAGICEVAWKQGVDFYGLSGNRLLLGYEYTSKYNLGYDDLPYNPSNPQNKPWPVISPKGRGTFQTIYEMLYHHYVVRKGLQMPFTKRVLLDHRRREDFVGVGSIVLSRGTLTHYRGDAPAGTAPAITSQPASLTRAPGQTATFAITATGNPTPTYRWQRNGVDIAGATANSFTTSRAIASDNGATYRCVVANNLGSATSGAATLWISGIGWEGSYWNNKDFVGTPTFIRTDAAIDFNWGTGAPAWGIPADNFSVRWRGIITPTYSQTYTFTATCDDGVRLYVDGVPVIQHWSNGSVNPYSGQIALTACRPVQVKMQYYEHDGNASAKLEWQSASQARQVVPVTAVTPMVGNDLPGSWLSQDVGTVPAAGAATESDGTWILQGSGIDIGGAWDAGRFTWQRIDGDVRISARMISLSATQPWAKAGVMLRETLTAGSRQAFTCVTAGNGVAFQRRPITDGACDHTAGPGPVRDAPTWISLERLGSTLISSWSGDGVNWSETRREQIPMAASVYVGLAITSDQDDSLATAQFDSVTITAAGNGTN